MKRCASFDDRVDVLRESQWRPRKLGQRSVRGVECFKAEFPSTVNVIRWCSILLLECLTIKRAEVFLLQCSEINYKFYSLFMYASRLNT